jgi:hypothetical protein
MGLLLSLILIACKLNAQNGVNDNVRINSGFLVFRIQEHSDDIIKSYAALIPVDSNQFRKNNLEAMSSPDSLIKLVNSGDKVLIVDAVAVAMSFARDKNPEIFDWESLKPILNIARPGYDVMNVFENEAGNAFSIIRRIPYCRTEWKISYLKLELHGYRSDMKFEPPVCPYLKLHKALGLQSVVTKDCRIIIPTKIKMID